MPELIRPAGLQCMVTEYLDSMMDLLGSTVGCLTCGLFAPARVRTEASGKGAVSICGPGGEAGMTSAERGSSCALCGNICGPGAERPGVTYTPIRP